MFGGSSSTEYEDIVNKTTDENLTSENWELILNLCDKVQDEKQPGAHAAIAAILKRLAHRNPNVQLYALSLTESLSKNLGIEIHRELASRAFTQGLEKLITDRNTHEKVRRRALGLIAMWTAEFEKDETLGIMEDCYNNLKAKNYKFEQPQEAPPPTVDDEIRRKEEEELQRVLEMSMQDKGGRGQWSDYSLAAGSSGAASGSSSSTAARSTTTATQAASSSSTAHPFAAPKYSGGGYVPARTPSPNTVAAQQRQQQQHYQEQLQKHNTTISSAAPEVVTPAAVVSTPAPAAATPAASSDNASGSPIPANMNIVTRVRALHTFEPTEPGELAFEKGDIIKVVDRGYKDWWRGQLKGRTGIFPVNYVEAMPEPTASELAKEAEREAAVFAQAVNVEKLLNMLRAMDPAKDNLADNEEIQELYRSSMALRPKIVKLIDKYSQKRADLVSMNETFVRARTIFDRMMEESLARHSGVYEQPTFRVPQYGQGRPDSRGAAGPGRRPEYQPAGPPQGYGWNPPPAAAVHEQPGYAQYAAPGASPYTSPGAGPGQQPPLQQVGGYGEPAGPYGAVPVQQQQQPQQQQQVPAGYGVVPQGGYAGHQPGAPYSQQGPTPYPVQGQQPQQQQQLLVQQQQQPLQQQPIQQQQQQQQPLQQPMQAQPVQQQQPLQQPIQQQPIQQPIQTQPVQQQQPLHQPVQALPVQQLPAQQQPIQHQQPVQVHQQPIQQQQPVQVHQEPVYAAASSPQPQPQSQPEVQTQPQPEPQPQPQPQAHAAPQQPISGPPPYVYNPSYTYADPNVQAWAQYYAQGGLDKAGSVYFISIPGVTDAQDNAAPATQSPDGQQPQQQQQQYQQQQPQQQPQQHQSQQTLGRQPSLQAQAYQAHPADSEVAYGAAAASSARATSPAQQQQQQPQPQTTGFQLHDQPAYGVYQQPALAQSPADGNTALPQASSPTRGAFGAVRQNSAGSPTQGASTPSWVLPKKTAPVAQGPAGDASYFPPTAGLGGLTLTDPGSGSAVSG